VKRDSESFIKKNANIKERKIEGIKDTFCISIVVILFNIMFKPDSILLDRFLINSSRNGVLFLSGIRAIAPLI
jgi:hypothetical protein